MGNFINQKSKPQAATLSSLEKDQPFPVSTSNPATYLQSAEVLARFFKGLADPTRFRILQLLVEKERNVSELVEILGSPQGRVSSHLACLRWCGYVSARKEGRWVYYGVVDPRITEIIRLAGGVVHENAANLLTCTIL